MKYDAPPTLSFSDGTSYTEYKLSEVLERVSEPVELQENEKYTEIGIKSHGKGIFYKAPTTKAEIGNKKVFWVKPNVLILNIVFAWEQAVARTTENDIGKIASHRFPMYKVKEGLLDLDYILYFFHTDMGKKVLGIASPGGAGRNKTLGQKVFENIKIPVPPLEDQKKISRTIRFLNEKIAMNLGKMQLLTERKSSYMQKIFSDTNIKLRFEEVGLFDLLKEKKLKNRDLKYGREDVLSVSGKHGVVNQIEHLGRSYAGESVAEYNVAEYSDVIYTKSPLKKNPYGIIKSNNYKTGIVSTLYAVFTCKDLDTSTYIQYYFDFVDNTNKYLRPLVHRGAKNDMKISNERFLSGKIPIPNEKNLKIFNKFAEQINKQQWALEKKISCLQLYRKGLLESLYFKRT